MTISPEAIRDMARSYTEAWNKRDPEAVGSHYADDGFISINFAEPFVGPAGIAEMAGGFIADVPDLLLTMDGLRIAGNTAVYLWTLEGTHSATGKKLQVEGWEEWTLSEDVKVAESRGRFDAVEYERQVQEGV